MNNATKTDRLIDSLHITLTLCADKSYCDNNGVVLITENFANTSLGVPDGTKRIVLSITKRPVHDISIPMTICVTHYVGHGPCWVITEDKRLKRYGWVRAPYGMQEILDGMFYRLRSNQTVYMGAVALSL